MRSLALVVTLSLTLAASAAEYHYLIPLAGYLAMPDGTYHYAYTTIQNLSPRQATITTTAVYPYFADAVCRTPDPTPIEPRERLMVSPLICMGRASAFDIVSDEPLIVRTELQTHKTRIAGWDKQIIDAPTAWIEPGVAAVTDCILRDDEGKKANLLVVNPSDATLTLTIEITRPDLRLSDTLTLEVPPRSTSFAPLSEVRDPHPAPFGVFGDGRHILTITGDGPWQGGVTSLVQGPSMYIPAVPLAP
jgi:hypothetical protein